MIDTMPTQPESKLDAKTSIAILGGGISGLAAAHRLRAQMPNARTTIFESSDRFGGVIRTEQHAGFLIEQSADSFLVNDQMPWAGELATAIGLDDELISPNAEYRRALIVKQGVTLPVPEGFYLMAAGDMSATWRSPLLSRAGKWRLWAERFVPKASGESVESLAEFACRRVGRETFERLVQPLVGGIYSADPDRLSVLAALPKFVEMEQRFGSLTAGLRQNAEQNRRTAGARYEMFRTPLGGLQSLVNRLVSNLSKTDAVSLKLHEQVIGLARRSRAELKAWDVTTTSGTKSFDAVISALPGPIASDVLENASTLSPIRSPMTSLAQQLGKIEHVGIAVVCLGYHRSQIQHPLDAFGLVVPDKERRDSIAISFASNKFPNRAPADHVLLRVFLGGALRPELVSLDEAELIARAVGEVESLLQADGRPVIQCLNRWQQTTPQYHVGHVERIANIERQVAKIPGFALAGNALRGVGIPQCIRSGLTAADKVISDLKNSE